MTSYVDHSSGPGAASVYQYSSIFPVSQVKIVNLAPFCHLSQIAYGYNLCNPLRLCELFLSPMVSRPADFVAFSPRFPPHVARRADYK